MPHWKQPLESGLLSYRWALEKPIGWPWFQGADLVDSGIEVTELLSSPGCLPGQPARAPYPKPPRPRLLVRTSPHQRTPLPRHPRQDGPRSSNPARAEPPTAGLRIRAPRRDSDDGASISFICRQNHRWHRPPMQRPDEPCPWERQRHRCDGIGPAWLHPPPSCGRRR